MASFSRFLSLKAKVPEQVTIFKRFSFKCLANLGNKVSRRLVDGCSSVIGWNNQNCKWSLSVSYHPQCAFLRFFSFEVNDDVDNVFMAIEKII